MRRLIEMVISMALFKKASPLITLSTLAVVLVIAQTVNAGKSVTAPIQKDVLGALMKNLDVQLKDAAHCKSVGVEQTDRTIGDYLSGFWAFHTSTTGKNWLDINTTNTGKGRYLVKVMIYRKDAEENWGWGVSFELDNSRKVNRGSFTCLGGG